jgi:hypothetical protein
MVIAELDKVRDAIEGFKAEFIAEHCPAGAGGQITRTAARFALVAAAGELATTLDIVPWPKGEAKTATANCFRAGLRAERG